MEIVERTPEEVLELVKTNKLSELEGTKETKNVEFRELPYNTSLPDGTEKKSLYEKIGKFDLVKDFISIGNSGGGVICIGIITDIEADERLEYVKKVIGIDRNLVKWSQWKDEILDSVFPKLKNDYFDYGYDNNVFWIKIKDAKKQGYFPLVYAKERLFDDDSGEFITKSTAFGIWERFDSENVSLFSGEKIQECLSKCFGDKQTSDIESRFQSIEDRLLEIENPVGTTEQPLPKDTNASLESSLNLFSDKLDYDKGYFYILAIPNKSKEIEYFWNRGDSSIPQMMKKPPYFRNYGWDLGVSTGEYPKPQRGGWEISNGTRKLLRIEKSGVVMTGATIDGFFDWGAEKPNKVNENTQFINGMAVAEYVAIFIQFVTIFSELFVESTYDFYFGFQTNQDYEYLIFNGKSIFDFWHAEPVTDLDNDYKQWVLQSINVRDENPDLVAGKVLTEIFASGFEVDLENNPFLIKSNSDYLFNRKLFTEYNK